MTYTEIRQLIEDAFEAGWAAETPTAWDNSPAVVDEQSWVRLSVLPYRASNSTLGDKRTLKSGNIVLQIFTPLDKGSGRAYELADLANTILENKRWGDLFTYAGLAEQLGKNPAKISSSKKPEFFQINLIIPFEANS